MRLVLGISRANMIIVITIILLFLVSERLLSRPSLNAFVGFSGISMFVYAADYALETDGELTRLVGEYYSLTGDAGFNIDFNSGRFGLIVETSFGYYKYYTFYLPNTYYTMLHAGLEPYMMIGDFSLGIGAGIFGGYMWDVLPGRVGESYMHTGLSCWASIGYRVADFLKADMRVRLHHFSSIDGASLYLEEKIENDYIVELRINYLIPLI